MPKTAIERFELKVNRLESGCWMWTGGATDLGYGLFWTGEMRAPRRPIMTGAHRWAYEHFVGPIPDGLHLDHLCRTPSCVNPEHLEPVTCRTNLLRGQTLAAANAAKTHCPQGHPYDEANTRFDARRGIRYCRICRNAASIRSRRKRLAKEKA